MFITDMNIGGTLHCSGLPNPPPRWSFGPRMPHLSNLDKARDVGQVEAGVSQKQVAVLFGGSHSAISKLMKFCEACDVK